MFNFKLFMQTGRYCSTSDRNRPCIFKMFKCGHSFSLHCVNHCCLHNTPNEHAIRTIYMSPQFCYMLIYSFLNFSLAFNIKPLKPWNWICQVNYYRWTCDIAAQFFFLMWQLLDPNWTIHSIPVIYTYMYFFIGDNKVVYCCSRWIWNGSSRHFSDFF